MESHPGGPSQRSEKNQQKSCPKAKGHMRRVSERSEINDNHQQPWPVSSPRRTQLLKKEHAEALLLHHHKYWQNTVWSRLNSFFLALTHTMFGGQNALHITPKKHHTKSEVWRRNITVCGCFSAYGTSKCQITERRIHGKMYPDVLEKNLLPVFQNDEVETRVNISARL